MAPAELFYVQWLIYLLIIVLFFRVGRASFGVKISFCYIYVLTVTVV